MQNSVNFPWPVNAGNAFPPNSPNGDPSKAHWQEYQNFAADFLFKNHQKNHQQNIYNQSAISQLAAHSHNYLESLSSSGHQLHGQPHQLPELNGFGDLNEKCPHYDDRSRVSCELCMQHYPLNFNNKESKNMQSNPSHYPPHPPPPHHSHPHHSHPPAHPPPHPHPVPPAHHHQMPNSDHHLAMLSTPDHLQTNSLSKYHSSNHANHPNHTNGLTIDANPSSLPPISSPYLGQNGSSTSSSGSSGSGRKCLNKGSFQCQTCFKSFTQKGNLKTHQLIHSGLKPFSCQVCGKSFTQKGNVDTHMKIHTGAKKSKKGSNNKSREFMNKDKFSPKDDFKAQLQQRHSSELSNGSNLMSPGQPDLAMNQNQNMMDRILPMQLNNEHSPVHFQHSTSSTASTPNWTDLTNNQINIANNLMNNSTDSCKSNQYDHFANYNSFAQQHMNLILNQNGKHSPTPNQSLMQHQPQLTELGPINNIHNSHSYNGHDFPPLLQ